MAHRFRLLELARLDRLLQAIWEDAVKGKAGAVERAIRIIDLQARIAGVYVAINVHNENLNALGEINVTITPD